MKLQQVRQGNKNLIYQICPFCKMRQLDHIGPRIGEEMIEYIAVVGYQYYCKNCGAGFIETHLIKKVEEKRKEIQRQQEERENVSLDVQKETDKILKTYFKNKYGFIWRFKKDGPEWADKEYEIFEKIMNEKLRKSKGGEK